MNLQSNTILVTGRDSGIGLALAEELQCLAGPAILK